MHTYVQTSHRERKVRQALELVKRMEAAVEVRMRERNVCMYVCMYLCMYMYCGVTYQGSCGGMQAWNVCNTCCIYA